MKFLKILIPLLITVSFGSCYYDVEEELYPTLECDTENITYSGDVLPIIESNCFSCHNQAANFGGITLEGYENLQRVATDGRLLGVIRHEPGFSPMPQGAPQLPECEIAKIERWISEGAPDN